MTTLAPTPEYTRGQLAAHRAIDQSVERESLTRQTAASHHLDVAEGAMDNGDEWSRGWIAYCGEIAGQ